MLYAIFYKPRNNLNLVPPFGDVCIQLLAVAKHRSYGLAVLNHALPVAHHLVVGLQEHPLDGFRFEMRSGTFLLAFEFPVALPDDLALRDGGVPDFLPIKAAAVSAHQLGEISFLKEVLKYHDKLLTTY